MAPTKWQVPQFLLILIQHASYFDSTSNHNRNAVWQSVPQLLHILILHQTTTCPHSDSTTLSCFISWFYIKPQPCTRWVWKNMRCFISWFYIKPQHTLYHLLQLCSCFISWFYIKPQLGLPVHRICEVASYLDSTSNHNPPWLWSPWCLLLHILILHQTTTLMLWMANFGQLLHILILHQTTTSRWKAIACWVASYLDSTSNHNSTGIR